MTIDGDILEIELSTDIKGVIELKNFIAPRLEYIEEIKVIQDTSIFASSALFGLLHSVKKTKPSIVIEMIDNDVECDQYGLIHWVRHD
ncbi:hypothetical protein SMGD1_2101 [Sulfurimonas gotlandica GD1]|jgi:hypothetical protein|uniref:STAS domain-containing protein n=1 Tax=Sulfurimonas gotlandica (strain DSM 19862 / JCM 16533 / GD1) TaxID=929558 RepID=H1FXC8_SULGG|nr:hypothetical protein [Sulfurimonas gotlandica]EHP30624.1 hypothetical protein SMGD1_2101 [Sulfurimonas gotlandica GD1]